MGCTALRPKSGFSTPPIFRLQSPVRPRIIRQKRAALEVMQYDCHPVLFPSKRRGIALSTMEILKPGMLIVSVINLVINVTKMK